MTPPAFPSAPPPALGGSLTVLRTFRLARVFKLARSWKELNRIISALGRSVTSVGYLSLLLLLLVFVFALMVCGVRRQHAAAACGLPAPKRSLAADPEGSLAAQQACHAAQSTLHTCIFCCLPHQTGAVPPCTGHAAVWVPAVLV